MRAITGDLTMCKVPDELCRFAYFSDPEFAWRDAEALKVVDWAASSGIAILGGEIWLPTTPGPTIPSPYIYTFETVRLAGENWGDFVIRANRNAAAYVRDFEWDEHDFKHELKMPYFNFTFERDRQDHRV
jgi:hypothetical protein